MNEDHTEQHLKDVAPPRGWRAHEWGKDHGEAPFFLLEAIIKTSSLNSEERTTLCELGSGEGKGLKVLNSISPM